MYKTVGKSEWNTEIEPHTRIEAGKGAGTAALGSILSSSRSFELDTRVMLMQPVS